MMVVMLVVLMSFLIFVFNSVVIVFIMDIWRWVWKQVIEREQLIVGKYVYVLFIYNKEVYVYSNCFIKKFFFQSVCSGIGGYQYFMDFFDKGGLIRIVVFLYIGFNRLYSFIDLFCIFVGCICVKGYRKGI